MKAIISGGGSGGHIFPAVAIANAIKARHADAQILFVGAQGRMEMEKVPAAGYEIKGLPIAGLQRQLTVANIFKNLQLPFKVIRSRCMVRGIIQDFNPDIVIFHYPNPYVTHFLLKSLPTNVQLFVYWHLDITKQKLLGKLFHFQNKALLKRANKVIATSPNYVDGSKYLSKVSDKCVVVPNCINEHRLVVTDESTLLSEKIKSENQGKILCLAVGRHVPYKGFKYLIKAFELLDDRFVLNIVGDGELTESLKSQAANNPNIHFLGKIDDISLKAYYLASDIFCFSSITKNEAFGIALAEAMYFGLPAVTFTIPGSGVNYVSINNETGLEVANKDVTAYSNAIKALGEDDALRNKYGEAASLRTVKNFLFAQYQRLIVKLMLGENLEEDKAA